MVRVLREVGQPFGGFVWGWTFTTQGFIVPVNTPWHWPGPRRGLRGSDRILAIEGQDPMTFPSVYRTREPGDEITYRVRRGNREFTVRVPLSRFTREQFLEMYGPYFLIGLSCLLAGYVLIRGASDRPTALIAFALLAMSCAALFHSHSGSVSRFYLNVPLLLLLFTPSYPLTGALLTHFFLTFPHPLSLLQHRPWLLRLPYAGAMILILGVVVASQTGGQLDTIAFRLSLIFAALGALLCAVRSLWAFLRSAPGERGQMGGFGVAMAVGFLLLLSAGVIPFFTGGTTLFLNAFFLPLLILYPLVLVYAMRNVQSHLLPSESADVKPEFKSKREVLDNPLTPRELEVLGLVAQGATNDEIAEALCISRHTVPTHLRNIYRKLGVHNRTAAVAEARRRGMLRG